MAVRQGGLSAELGTWVHPRVAITEPGLYALTLKSRKPEAKRFRKWISSWNPWFVAAEVCRACGIKQPTRAVEPLDADEKGVISIHTLGGPQEMLCV